MANKQAWKNGVKTQFRGNSAVNAQKKAAEVQRNNGRLRCAAEELVTPEVAKSIIKAHIDKSLAGDAKSTEIIRDLLGEKPVDKVEQTINEIAFRIEGVSDEEADAISG